MIPRTGVFFIAPVLLLCVLPVSTLTAENRIESSTSGTDFGINGRERTDYEEFLAVNSTYVADKTVLVKQVMIKRKKSAGYNTNDAYCLFHASGQCVRINFKRTVQYFFSSNEGYWLFTKKLKSPLKISGSYKVEELEVQDLLKTDFKHEYTVIASEAGILTLERKTTGPVYKYILFQKTGDATFELTFTDTKKKPVRKFVYHRGTVDGYDCFKQIDIYNVLFNKDIGDSWITEWIKPVEVPHTLFHYAHIKALTQKMETLIP